MGKFSALRMQDYGTTLKCYDSLNFTHLKNIIWKYITAILQKIRFSLHLKYDIKRLFCFSECYSVVIVTNEHDNPNNCMFLHIVYENGKICVCKLFYCKITKTKM